MIFLFTLGFHAIIDWFNQHKRDLPWRNSNDPYQVWISEIMLQQTQVDVVIDYYLNWMKKFATLKELADAQEDDVIKAFSGLGYYSRARNMHKTAKICLKMHGGKIPNDKKELLNLPGIGSYTAGAILAFGFKQKASAVDGNVLRVMSRLLGFFDPIDLLKTKVMVEKILDDNLPENDPEIVMEGLIELGACICKKKPECHRCPVKGYCIAFQNKTTHLLPVKSKKTKQVVINKLAFILKSENRYYVDKKMESEWNAGLFEFPENLPGQFVVKREKKLKPITAYITHHKLIISPIFQEVDRHHFNSNNWKTLEEMNELPFSSAHRKIWEKIKNEHVDNMTTCSIEVKNGL